MNAALASLRSAPGTVSFMACEEREEIDHSEASRFIRETVADGLIQPADPTGKLRKFAGYLPFWA